MLLLVVNENCPCIDLCDDTATIVSLWRPHQACWSKAWKPV